MKMTVGVMGPSGKPSTTQMEDAFAVGQLVATRQLVLLSGGMDGTMEAACRGAKSAGGFVVAVSSSHDKYNVNKHVDVAIATGMGGGRNYMNILSSDIVIGIGCNRSAGTLSEIAFALQSATPLMLLRPPDAMRAFLTGFEAPGKAHFAESPDEVAEFIDELVPFIIEQRLREQSRRARRR